MCLNRGDMGSAEQMSKMNDVSVPNSKIMNFQNVSHFSKILGRRLSKNMAKLQEEKYPELTMRSFFEFMRTAYGVHNSFEELVDTVTANSEIDWNALAKTELHSKLEDKEFETDIVLRKNEEHNESDNKNKKSDIKNDQIETVDETTASTAILKQCSQKQEPFLSKIMKKHLSDVLHEGLLDSVLPYMIPRSTLSENVLKNASVTNELRKSISIGDTREILKTSKDKTKDRDNTVTRRKSFENEIEIHVCDEAKNLRKDFRCPQRLLIQNMCYFADVTAGQKLEEIDISVHCDIVIFDWLMRWVKKDIIKKSEWPILEANNVIPIMVSASFLQMEPLLNNCLQFCHDHMSEILKTSSVLSCLNDNLLTRLADLFINTEAEALKDKKDKIQSKLFCKLIMSLANPIPDNSRGHYSSLANLFICGKCDKNIIRSLSDFIPCLPSSMQIDNYGNIHSRHSRNLAWNLDGYIVRLRSELSSWRKVYWKLWGDCHFLFCLECETYFPVNQMDWCPYHSENPQFFANEQKNSTSYPIGRYPCCSQRTFRFEALPNRDGCKFKEHLPKIVTKQEECILELFSNYRDIIAIEPPNLYFPEKITRLVARDPSLECGKIMCKESAWWDGIELASPRPKLGLLGKIWDSGVRKPCQTPTKNQRKLKRQESRTTDGSSPISSVTDSDDNGEASECESSLEDDSYNSEESQQLLNLNYFRRRRKCPPKMKKNNISGPWNAELTIRCNQDNQREFEEKLTKQIISMLTKKTNVESEFTLKSKSSFKSQIQPLGGTYVKLEAEFRDQLTQSFKNKHLAQNLTRHIKSAKQ